MAFYVPGIENLTDLFFTTPFSWDYLLKLDCLLQLYFYYSRFFRLAIQLLYPHSSNPPRRLNCCHILSHICVTFHTFDKTKHKSLLRKKILSLSISNRSSYQQRARTVKYYYKTAKPLKKLKQHLPITGWKNLIHIDEIELSLKMQIKDETTLLGSVAPIFYLTSVA